ncbi:MAG: ATP-binding cassette domain-containing protein, partial [Eubacteriales bacterium]
MAYLRIANLKKSYRVSRTETQQVLRGINVEFKRGEFVAVLGESGCGKSTFMNILGGLDQDYTGSIVLDGEFLKDYSEKKLDDYRKSRVGLIFQNYN